MGASLGPAEAVGEHLPDRLRVELLAAGEGRAVITASRGSEPSHYRFDRPYTYFGQALMDALRGRDVPDSGGYIGLFELYLSIYNNVKVAATGPQEPMLTIVEGVGPFPVAFFPNRRPTTPGEPPIRKDVPGGAAVEVMERSVVALVGRESVAVAGNVTGGSINTGTRMFTHGTGSPIVQGDGNIVVPGLTSLIDMGGLNRFGSVKTGDLVVGSVTKVSISREARQQRDTVVDSDDVERLRCAVSRLVGVPQGKRDDLNYNLSKAEQAAAANDLPRLREKLIEARGILDSLANLVAGAKVLAREAGDLADYTDRSG